jgi:AGCS family alanine or glycine:cation symporter
VFDPKQFADLDLDPEAWPEATPPLQVPNIGAKVPVNALQQR